MVQTVLELTELTLVLKVMTALTLRKFSTVLMVLTSSFCQKYLICEVWHPAKVVKKGPRPPVERKCIKYFHFLSNIVIGHFWNAVAASVLFDDAIASSLDKYCQICIRTTKCNLPDRLWNVKESRVLTWGWWCTFGQWLGSIDILATISPACSCFYFIRHIRNNQVCCS